MQDKKLADNKLIGKFAALAVSDTVYITSCHDGTKTQYLMYRDGVSIKIDELSTEPTSEHNGLDILAYIKGDKKDAVESITNALKYLVYFNKLFATCSLGEISGEWYYNDRVRTLKYNINKFNDRKIYTEGLYKYTNLDSSFDLGIYAILGDVIYPIKETIDPWIKEHNGKYCPNCDLGITFEVGELDVTPNREELLYDAKTNAALKKKIADLHTELCTKAAACINSTTLVSPNGKVISELWGLLNGSRITYSVGKANGVVGNNIFLAKDDVSPYVSFDGKTYSNTVWGEVGQLASAIEIGSALVKDRYYKTFRKNEKINIFTLLGDTRLYQKDGDMLSGYKQYLADTHSSNDTVTVVSFAPDVKCSFSNISKEATHIYTTILNRLKACIPVLSKTTVPASYFEVTKKQSKASTNERIAYDRMYDGWSSRHIEEVKYILSEDSITYLYDDTTELIAKALCRTRLLSLYIPDSTKYIGVKFIKVVKKNEARILEWDNVKPITDLLSPDAKWATTILTAEAAINEFKKYCSNVLVWDELTSADHLKNLPGYKEIVATASKIHDLEKIARYSDAIQVAKNIGAQGKPANLNITKDQQFILTINAVLRSGEAAFGMLYELLSGKTGKYNKDIDTLKQLLK